MSKKPKPQTKNNLTNTLQASGCFYMNLNINFSKKSLALAESGSHVP